MSESSLMAFQTVQEFLDGGPTPQLGERMIVEPKEFYRI